MQQRLLLAMIIHQKRRGELRAEARSREGHGTVQVLTMGKSGPPGQSVGDGLSHLQPRVIQQQRITMPFLICLVFYFFNAKRMNFFILVK